jgi:hypothetical protein
MINAISLWLLTYYVGTYEDMKNDELARLGCKVRVVCSLGVIRKPMTEEEENPFRDYGIDCREVDHGRESTEKL